MRDARTDFSNAIRANLGFGPDAAAIQVNKITRFSTSDRRRDDAGWCKLFADERGGVYGDFRTNVTATWQSNSSRTMTPDERAEAARAVQEARQLRRAQEQADHARYAAANARTWAKTVEVRRGDPVAKYLAGRGINLWPLPACLRLHRGLPYFEAGKPIATYPAMIAPLVALDGRIVTLHRTYLAGDGGKAPVSTAKKLARASGSLTGATIPLAVMKNGVIGIAEGIETALAARCASGVPVVAAYCASNLAAWHWPAGARRIVIFGDNDEAGREAAFRLKQRAMVARIDTEIVTPSTLGADWNDVLLASQEVAS